MRRPARRPARQGPPRVRRPQPSRPAPDVNQVARNVQANIRKLADEIHGQVYANVRQFTPDQILTALGAKAALLLEALAACERMIAMPIEGPPWAPEPILAPPVVTECGCESCTCSPPAQSVEPDIAADDSSLTSTDAGA